MPEIPYRLIQLYTEPGDTVLDPFCGIGTTSIVARDLGRNSIGVDISQEYIDIAKERMGWHDSDLNTEHIIERGDATNLHFGYEVADFVCSSPPYYQAKDYLIKDDNDIGRNQPYEEYLSQMKQSLTEMYRVLKRDKYCCIVVSQMKENGKCYWIAADLYRLGEKVGFTFEEYKVLRLIAWLYVDFVLVFHK